MNTTITEICDALDSLGDKVNGESRGDSTLTETSGWSSPPITANDMAEMAWNISAKLRKANITDIDSALEERLNEITDRIEIFLNNTLAYLTSSNSVHGAQVYLSLINWINFVVEPLFNWEILADNKAMPSQLARRLRGIKAELENLIPNKEEIEGQISLIKEATETAESLPADLDSLKQSRAEVKNLSSSSAELYGKIDTYHQQIEEKAKLMNEKLIEAESIVNQCSEAYRVTTSIGLAAAFDARAGALSKSMWIWVIGLLVALGVGAWIGAYRVTLLTELIKAPNQQWGGIWIELILSFLSISAPIWFAWLATKQINQRFRLSEDYAFKASVAKAYEGYRREAVRIDSNQGDPEFEARLFASALTRLEEAPLRLVESDHHGSPWHELLQSQSLVTALNTVPNLKDQLLTAISKSTTLVKGKAQDSPPIEEEA